MRNQLQTMILVMLCILMTSTHAGEITSPVRLATLGPGTANFPGLLAYQGPVLTGYFSTLFSCAGSQMGIEFTFQGAPFARAQRYAQSGAAQGFFPANITEARDEFATASTPIISDAKTLITRTDYQAANPQQPLSYIGVMRGAYFELSLAEALDHPVVLVDSYEQLARMLHTGRIGGLVASETFIKSAFSAITGMPPLHFRPLEQAPMHAYFTHEFLSQHPAFLTQFNHAVELCRPEAAQQLHN